MDQILLVNTFLWSQGEVRKTSIWGELSFSSSLRSYLSLFALPHIRQRLIATARRYCLSLIIALNKPNPEMSGIARLPFDTNLKIVAKQNIYSHSQTLHQ